MCKLCGLANIEVDAFRPDHGGCLGPNSSHFLRYGPGMDEVYVGQ
jgi:hypothetical protein